MVQSDQSSPFTLLRRPHQYNASPTSMKVPVLPTTLTTNQYLLVTSSVGTRDKHMAKTVIVNPKPPAMKTPGRPPGINTALEFDLRSGRYAKRITAANI